MDIHIGFWIIPLILTIIYTIMLIISTATNETYSMYPDIGRLFNMVIYIIILLFTWLVYFILNVIFA